MPKAKLTGEQEVAQFLETLEHPLKEEIRKVRAIILDAHPNLTEHIKWKAPSFCLEGEDCITMKLFPPKHIQLIFHRGATVKQVPEEKLIDDTTGLLTWATNDRAVATFRDRKDIQLKENGLRKIIEKWITAIESSH